RVDEAGAISRRSAHPALGVEIGDALHPSIERLPELLRGAATGESTAEPHDGDRFASRLLLQFDLLLQTLDGRECAVERGKPLVLRSHSCSSVQAQCGELLLESLFDFGE